MHFRFPRGSTVILAIILVVTLQALPTPTHARDRKPAGYQVINPQLRQSMYAQARANPYEASFLLKNVQTYAGLKGQTGKDKGYQAARKYTWRKLVRNRLHDRIGNMNGLSRALTDHIGEYYHGNRGFLSTIKSEANELRQHIQILGRMPGEAFRTKRAQRQTHDAMQKALTALSASERLPSP
jgi:hypothetical protein